MARTPNAVATEKVHLSTTPQVLEALDALVKTGMFGKTRTEVAEELMRLKLREVMSDGWADGDVSRGSRTGTRSSPSTRGTSSRRK